MTKSPVSRFDVSISNFDARGIVVRATHPQADDAPAIVRKYVRYGSSPRAAQAMVLAAKVLALRAGRANVAFADVEKVAPMVLEALKAR